VFSSASKLITVGAMASERRSRKRAGAVVAVSDQDRTALEAAHAAMLAGIRTIPDAALPWRPAGGEFSLQEIIAHLAEANEFYLTIVEAARSARFGMVELQPQSAAWNRILATVSTVRECQTVSAALAHFERTYERVLGSLSSLSPEEMDRGFVFRTWQPDAKAIPTTLRRRVVREMANHLREHEQQLVDTLTAWRAAAHEAAT
jgi:hypothetical protein